jgi:hypothetical protein
MRILIGLECSCVIRDAFLEAGHDTWSCDLKPAERDPSRHYQCDILSILDKNWDMLIAHPVCRFNAHSGSQWYYHPEDKHLPKEQRRPHPLYPTRRDDQKKAIALFKALWNAPIEKNCLENPLPLPELVQEVGKWNPKIQPFFFGDRYQKTTCLWLKNLPELIPTRIVDRGEFIMTKGGKRIPKWYSDAKTSDKEKTSTTRSRTFEGIAKAMASQWGNQKFTNYKPYFFN